MRPAAAEPGARADAPVGEQQGAGGEAVPLQEVRDRAGEVMDRMVKVFERKELNPKVIQRIRQQAEATKSSIAAEVDGGSSQDEE